MSFKKFSGSQAVPANDKTDGKTKTAPADGKSAAQPVKKQNESAPARKS